MGGKHRSRIPTSAGLESVESLMQTLQSIGHDKVSIFHSMYPYNMLLLSLHARIGLRNHQIAPTAPAARQLRGMFIAAIAVWRSCTGVNCMRPMNYPLI